jgi:uncharacterized protein YgbK (DUF1537 family)
MTNHRQLILADDLTGACDAAAPFTAGGRSVCVRWGASSLADNDCDTVAICLETRALQSSDAENVAFRYARKARDLGFQHVLQKMDSTLKGNFAAEMAGVLRAYDYWAALVAPAFPEMGRQIIDSRLLVDNEASWVTPSLLEMIQQRCAFPVHPVA